ncbi:hypothetical protein ACFQPA_06670 [Halomarina halobia]|uniref:Type IV pilin n=1 Tax=Halomarina halobia TaxID=3033386 RepID=A0ABD6A7A1_9EURY|nr:hypothetical protein [Halomarina sp. PSR21]
MPSDRARDPPAGDERQSGVFGQVGDRTIVAVSTIVVLAGVVTLVVWGVPSLIDAGADAPPTGAGGGNATDAPGPRTESTPADAPAGNESGQTGARTPTSTPTSAPTGERSNGTSVSSSNASANASGDGWHDLRLAGESGRMEPYTIAVSGELRRSGPRDPNDAADVIAANGSQVTGEVGGGTDTYEFTGSVTRVRTGGNTTVYVDGRPVSEPSGGGTTS